MTATEAENIIKAKIETMDTETQEGRILQHLYKQALDASLIAEFPHIQTVVAELIANPLVPEIPADWGIEHARADEGEATRIVIEADALYARAQFLRERAAAIRRRFDPIYSRDSRQATNAAAL